ncbi:MAG TPA: phosphohistidine phosphatase SixA [Ktedonobacterales bacterium]
MNLYFLRHGKAGNPQPSPEEDARRPLTSQGRDEMRAAAHGLGWLGVKPDTIYSSPLKRAFETAAIVADVLGREVTETPLLAPGSDLRRIVPLLSQHDDNAALFLVGHEPNLSDMIGQLISPASKANVSLKKGACCYVELATGALHQPDLAGEGTVMWLMTAKHLGRLGR